MASFLAFAFQAGAFAACLVGACYLDGASRPLSVGVLFLFAAFAAVGAIVTISKAGR